MSLSEPNWGIPANEAYSAAVFELDMNKSYALDGLDNLVGYRVMGYQALIPKNYESGLYLMFPPETQLSNDYASNNNLFRHSNLNVDSEAKGYIEDNRRVKAIKMRGNISSCMIMPIDSLKYLNVDLSYFKAGDFFDEINGNPICNKYVIKEQFGTQAKSNAEKIKFSRVDKRMLPEHISTEQWWRHNKEYSDRVVSVTQKVHGTSIRLSRIPVNRELSWVEKIAKRIGIRISETEQDYVYGSKKVIKDPKNPAPGYYTVDVWSEIGDKYKDAIPDNTIVYGEILGWVDENTAIQKNYTYNLKPGEKELYVYRVAMINEQGILFDLSWDGVVEFCNSRGLKHVPEIWRGLGRNLNVDDFMDKKFYDSGFKNCLPLSDAKSVDEGVIIRSEGIVPKVAKAKSPEFLVHETKDLDKGEINVEDSQ